MKLCPVCECQNADGAKNCETCGESLSIPQSTSAPATSAPSTPPSATPAAAAQPAPAQTAAKPASPAQPAIAVQPLIPAQPTNPKGPRYCPIEGIEYASDSPEHGDGYCSCGAELVADRALIREGAAPLPPEERALPAVATPSAAPTPAPAAPAQAQPTAPIAPAVPSGPVVPAPGTWCLVVYKNKQPVHYHALLHDETLIGRGDPTSDAYPELDLSPFDESAAASRKHAYVYRQEGAFSLKPISNAGTQLGRDLVPMGERRALQDGDVLILGGKVALKLVLVK